MKYELGTLLKRRLKHGNRCGDLFVVVEVPTNGIWYGLLSLRKDGHATISRVNEHTINGVYETIGHVAWIEDLFYLAKRQ